MFGFKLKSKSVNLEDYHLQLQRFRLVNRVKSAIKDNINYETRLRNFLVNNQHNQELVIKVIGYMKYQKSLGVDVNTASRQCLEEYGD